jgi:hypothetical protein
MDSRLRGNDKQGGMIGRVGMTCRAGMTNGADKWIPACVIKKIPACAGMTCKGGMTKGADKWIPD